MSKVLPVAEPSPAVAECTVSRRESVRRIGGWVIYAGVLGSSTAIGAACGRTPLGLPFGDDNPTGTPTLTPTQTVTGTPSATPTGTGASCVCAPPGGIDTTLTTADVPLNGVAYNPAGYFICHDSLGFYAMTSHCTHVGNDMGPTCNQGSSGGTFSTTNLAGGFKCCFHGSQFDANGNVTNGPATLPLQHYLLTIESTNQHLYLNVGVLTDPSCRCT